MAEIRDWYEFTLAQIAADSYLDKEYDQDFNFNDNAQVRERLELGANHYHFQQINADKDNYSATRMTGTMIDDFFDTWEIVKHQQSRGQPA